MSELERNKRAAAFGAYLNSLRTGMGLSLRQVESITKKKVSNPYLSQLEKGKIFQPSPHVLYALSQAYRVEYQKMMEKAGYSVQPESGSKRTKPEVLRSHSIENLTAEEEKELLHYLTFWRSKNSAK